MVLSQNDGSDPGRWTGSARWKTELPRWTQPTGPATGRRKCRAYNAQSPDRNESLDQAPHKSSDLRSRPTKESAMRFARTWLLAVPLAALLAGGPARAVGTLTIAQ